MDIKQKKKWLNRYRYLDLEIKQKREQLIKWQSMARKTTTTLSNMPKPKGTEIEDKTAEIVAKILDLNNEINYDILRLLSLKGEIETAIGNVENHTYRLLLTMRYIDFKKWEQIAVEMNYSWQNIHILHKKALNSIKIRVN